MPFCLQKLIQDRCPAAALLLPCCRPADALLLPSAALQARQRAMPLQHEAYLLRQAHTPSACSHRPIPLQHAGIGPCPSFRAGPRSESSFSSRSRSALVHISSFNSRSRSALVQMNLVLVRSRSRSALVQIALVHSRSRSLTFSFSSRSVERRSRSALVQLT